MTLETVASDTPAFSATACMVGSLSPVMGWAAPRFRWI
ncbi:hypothetical protein SRIMM317S_03994 [Streptomyces rimosus subsp. rimosus]